MIALFVLALVLASWVPRVPQIKADLRLGDGRLGLALLGAPVGAVLTRWLTGIAVTRFGSVPVVRPPCPATAPSDAVVSAVGYAGWLTGPPVVGGLAELIGLHRALTVVLVLLATIVAFAPALRAPRPDPAAGEQCPVRPAADGGPASS